MSPSHLCALCCCRTSGRAILASCWGCPTQRACWPECSAPPQPASFWPMARGTTSGALPLLCTSWVLLSGMFFQPESRSLTSCCCDEMLLQQDITKIGSQQVPRALQWLLTSLGLLFGIDVFDRKPVNIQVSGLQAFLGYATWLLALFLASSMYSWLQWIFPACSNATYIKRRRPLSFTVHLQWANRCFNR